MKQLNYILFEEGDDFCIGFNKHNDEGFIDDGFGWSDEDRDSFAEEVLEKLVGHIYPYERNSFTYDIHNVHGLEEILAEMGINKMEQGWD